MHGNRQQIVRIGQRRTPRKISWHHLKWLFQGVSPPLVDISELRLMPPLVDIKDCRINGKSPGRCNSSITARSSDQCRSQCRYLISGEAPRCPL